MNYEEIKAKYQPQAREREYNIEKADRKIAVIKAQISEYDEQQKQCRDKSGLMTPESKKVWDNAHMQLSQLNRQLEAARIQKSEIEIGESGLKVIDEMISRNI